MKCSVSEIILAGQVLNALMSQNFTGRQAFTIARLNRVLQQKAKGFETVRQELISKYADKNDAGEPILDEQGNVHIADEHIPMVNKELNEILNTEIELGEVSKIPAEWLDNVSLSPAQFDMLMPFIEG